MLSPVVALWVPLAAIPGAIAGLVLGIRRFEAAKLRTIGWALVGVYTLSLGLLAVSALQLFD